MVKLDARKANRQIVNDFKQRCFLCGETSKFCLEIHHVGPKRFNVSQALNSKDSDEIIEELKNCITLCSNCHKKVHAGELKIDPKKEES